jgi:hypothetical protein
MYPRRKKSGASPITYHNDQTYSMIDLVRQNFWHVSPHRRRSLRSLSQTMIVNAQGVSSRHREIRLTEDTNIDWFEEGRLQENNGQIEVLHDLLK